MRDRDAPAARPTSRGCLSPRVFQTTAELPIPPPAATAACSRPAANPQTHRAADERRAVRLQGTSRVATRSEDRKPAQIWSAPREWATGSEDLSIQASRQAPTGSARVV